MTASGVALTTSKISILEAPLLEKTSRANPLLNCDLKWRQDKLLIRPLNPVQKNCLPALRNEQWFRECLNSSSVQTICLDLDLNETGIKLWADACQAANKQARLRLPALQQLPQKRRPLSWQLKRLADRAAAAVLLLVLSPLMLVLAFLVAVSSPGPIFFQQWRVGQRGKLFRIMKFRTMVVDAEKQHHLVMGAQAGLHKRKDDPRITSVGGWMRKYSLDELPQLFNVVRGEMSLVGPRPWALYDAVRINQECQVRLNALPGITGAWQVESRSTLVDLDAVNRRDLQYLRDWSVAEDFKILLLTVPKVLSGFGAY